MMNTNPRPDGKSSLTAPNSTVQLRIQALDEVLEAILQTSSRKNTGPGHQRQQTATADHQNRDMKGDIIRQILPLIEPAITSADQAQRVMDSKIVKDYYDPYLQGINIAESMSNLGKERKNQLNAQTDDELFDLSRIREFRAQLQQLVDGDEDQGDAKTHRDRVMTFLTEQYPPYQTEKGQEQLDDEFEKGGQTNLKMKRYQVKSKQRILVE